MKTRVRFILRSRHITVCNFELTDASVRFSRVISNCSRGKKGDVLYANEPVRTVLSFFRTPRDSLKYFEMSVPRHIRFAEMRKK